MTYFTALLTICVLLLSLAAVAILVEAFRKAKLWERFENTSGGPESALTVLKAAEATEQQLDNLLRAGMRALPKAKVLHFPTITNRGKRVCFEDDKGAA